MLRTFVKNGVQNNLRKCVLLQSDRTFADKGIIKREDFSIEKKSSPISLSNLKNNLEPVKQILKPWMPNKDPVPWIERTPEISPECDVVIIGGGAIGSSIAYWLKKKVYKDMKVIVVEKDPTYTKASTVLSLGGLRQQFSLEENIEMSLFGAEFIRNINEYLGIEGEPTIDPYFHPYGYLMLAGENGVETLMQNSRLQNFLGAKNILLTKTKLKDMFPWMNVEDVELGCLGIEKEGWFDPWSLLSAFKKKALVLGAEYAYAEAKGFTYKDEHDVTHRRLNELVVETPEGETRTIKFAVAVIAAGPASGKVASMAEVIMDGGLHHLHLPVEPRKRYIYCFHCPEGPGLNTPVTIDFTGSYFRREGLAGTYVCGKSPTKDCDEPSVDDLSVDHDFFNDVVWPELAQRVPCFEKLKVNSSWAGYYEYNTFDQNGIIGTHPFYKNLLFATGFSGHGIQQSPAIGRAVAELIVEGRYMTIDLKNFDFNRVIYEKPMYEANII